MINTGRQTLLTGELAAAKSREALKIALSNVRDCFNYNHVSLLRVPVDAEKLLAPLLHESTLPANFLREFDRSQLLGICPAFSNIRQSLMPHSWALKEISTAGAKPAMLELIDLFTRFDMESGSVFSFYLADGHRYALRFDGKRPQLGQNDVNELSLLSLQALNAFSHIHIAKDSQHSPLSARELEVVSWTAQGKTSVEIGQILTLSDHTVNAYLTNAIRKLDCVNRTQLVAKALRLKIIS